MFKGATMRGRLEEKLPIMFSLARQHNEAARIELAGMLADVFLSDSAELTLREQELVNELIDQLMRTKSPVLRAHLAERFADTTRMPRQVAVNLATDPIEIAGPILVTCKTLTDQDLINVTTTQSRLHARAIATREEISEAVADALVTTGDVRVMQIVAENLGAQLSTRAVEVVADAARFSAELREPIIKRNEMTAQAAEKLYWWISQDLRRYSLKRFAISSGKIDEALAKTVDDLLSYHVLDKANDSVMQQVAEWLIERQAASVKILPQILRLQHFRLFNILLAYLSNLDVSLIDTIVAASGGRELAVVCRALGIDKPGFVSIFLLSRAARLDDHVVHPRELSQALQSYDRLTTNLAHDLLRSWKINPAFVNRGSEDVVLEA